MVLQGILRRAVVRGLIPANPLTVVGKPRQPPTRRPEPLSPATIERVRAQLSQRDATLVSLMAYAGLRPDEATKARWRDLGERTLHVHASKTERSRTVDVLAPLVRTSPSGGWPAAARPTARSSARPTTATNGGFTTGRTGAVASTSRRRRRRGDGRPSRLPASRLLRVAAAVGGAQPHLRRRAGRPQRRHAREPQRGALKELEDEPRIRAVEAIRAARAEIRCAQNVRTEEAGEGDRPGESPATTGVGDTGLEPVTSALSRRRSPS